MPRRIRQDEPPACRLEVAVGHIDGNALFPLSGQPIHQQRVINPAGHRAVAAAVAFQCRLHIIGDAAAFIQHPADQGGFPIIDAAAGQHAQKGVGHQKYPSRFFFSIDDS